MKINCKRKNHNKIINSQIKTYMRVFSLNIINLVRLHFTIYNKQHTYAKVLNIAIMLLVFYRFHFGQCASKLPNLNSHKYSSNSVIASEKQTRGKKSPFHGRYSIDAHKALRFHFMCKLLNIELPAGILCFSLTQFLDK